MTLYTIYNYSEDGISKLDTLFKTAELLKVSTADIDEYLYQFSPILNLDTGEHQSWEEFHLQALYYCIVSKIISDYAKAKCYVDYVMDDMFSHYLYNKEKFISFIDNWNGEYADIEAFLDLVYVDIYKP